jgi:hypothetical protein
VFATESPNSREASFGQVTWTCCRPCAEVPTGVNSRDTGFKDIYRSDDGIRREKQLLIDSLCQSAEGLLYYSGRDMKTSHKGMRISDADWSAFMTHVNATLDHFGVPELERGHVIAFVESTKSDMVEA